MKRRDFLKNSIGFLLFGSLASNKTLAKTIECFEPKSIDVLLYLIQTKDGDWKIKGTIWKYLAKQRLSSLHYNLDTFKALKVVDNSDANKFKKYYWNKYNCNGRCVVLDYLQSYKNGIQSKENGQLKSIQSIGGIAAGKILYKNNIGLFGMSDVRTNEIKVKGGKVMGRVAVEKGTVFKAAKASVKSPNHINNKRLTCPHCNKEGGYTAMKRHHMDRCKYKSI